MDPSEKDVPSPNPHSAFFTPPFSSASSTHESLDQQNDSFFPYNEEKTLQHVCTIPP